MESLEMRVADYIADYIYSKIGTDTIFLVPGGGSMFLTDGIKCHPHLKYVCCHHEQAASMAASGYARYTGKVGVCSTTSGVGGTNAITGVLDAYQDNVPLMVISGQIKRKETISRCGLKLRQFGVQEANIIPIVESITKYAVMVNEPEKIRYHLERATYEATKNPPGPVWLDIPLDVQATKIDDSSLEPYVPEKEKKFCPTNELSECACLINQSKRLIIIAGHGIILAKAVEEFRKFIEENQIPVVESELGMEVLPYDHPLNFGKIGTKGMRAANFAVQNADLILAIGSRLSVCTTGQDYELFGREAKKIVVDINAEEHKKKTVKIDLFLQMDAKDFIETINFVVFPKIDKNWVPKCQEWKQKWPTYQPEFVQTEKVNLYYFMEMLNQKLKTDSVLVGDAGSSCFVLTQGIKLREKQRLILSAAQTCMGFVIPTCVGISIAKKGEAIGIVGDGSFQMNIQELQTIVHHNLPIKLFVWNNEGYLTMRNTQNNFFKGLIGADKESGISFPSFKGIADAYGIKYMLAPNSKSLPTVIQDVLDYNGPVICEVLCLYDQKILTVSSKQLPDGTFVSRPLEDMAPFLPREEFLREMIVIPTESSR